MVFMGTAVTYGRGEMLVTGTGLQTELGKIASLLMGVEESRTPLQKRIDRLGVLLVRGAVGVVVIVFIAGVLRGLRWAKCCSTRSASRWLLCQRACPP